MLEDADLVEMGVSNEKEREQLLAAAKGLAARVMTAYLPPPPVNTHNNNNEGDKDSCPSDSLAQVRHCSWIYAFLRKEDSKMTLENFEIYLYTTCVQLCLMPHLALHY